MIATAQEYLVSIDGQWRGARSGRTFETINPFTGAAWATLPRCAAEDVEEAAAAARKAFDQGPWGSMSASDRGRLLLKLAALAGRDAERLAEIEVRDNGKLYAEMRGQMHYAVRWWEYFGGLADKIEGAVLPIDKADYFTFTLREPFGPVALITPWNSPLMLATWKMAPALAAGNTVVWKPSEFTSASAVHFMRLVEEAGFPAGVVNLVTGFGPEVGEPLVAHREIRKVAFTGGDATGERVYASAARGLKPAVMELGGKSANIVFEDAVIDEAVKGAVAGIFAGKLVKPASPGRDCCCSVPSTTLLSNGSCSSRGRRNSATRCPRKPRSAPLRRRHNAQRCWTTSPSQRRKVRRLSWKGCGHRRGSSSTLFVQPTIFTNVRNDMRIAREEVFGPVLAVIPFDDEADAVRIANDSVFGLAAGVWTADAKRMLRARPGNCVWGRCGSTPIAQSASWRHLADRGVPALAARMVNMQSRSSSQTKSVWIHVGNEAPSPFAMRWRKAARAMKDFDASSLLGLSTVDHDHLDERRESAYREFLGLPAEQPSLAIHWMLFGGFEASERPDGNPKALRPVRELPFPRRMWAGGQLKWIASIPRDVPLQRSTTVIRSRSRKVARQPYCS